MFRVLNITLKDNGANKIKRHKQNSLAIMIKEDGSTEYVKSSFKGIPIGENYYLDYDKSYCKNNGIIGNYDNTLSKVSFSFIGTDSCYLYFEEFIKPDISNATINYDVDDSNVMTINIAQYGHYNEIPNISKYRVECYHNTFFETSLPLIIDLSSCDM